jgi:coproporphyrinogen III oxidase-like Fe-S oxidoreductase
MESETLERIEKKLDMVLDKLNNHTEYHVEFNPTPIDIEQLKQTLNKMLGKEIY